MTVRDGKFAYVGDEAGATPQIGPDTRVLRVEGMTVLPGLIDSHIHAAEGALGLGGCSVDDQQLTVEAAGKIIRECLAKDAEKGWRLVSEVNSAGFRADRKALESTARVSIALGKPSKSHGKLYLEEEAMKLFFRRADAEGFKIHVHAIGDAAVRETLTAVEAARAAGGKRLYSISHLQSIDPADVPRFAKLDTVFAGRPLKL